MTLDPQWLRDVRKTLGLTQTEMAAEMGLSFRGYQDIEAGASKLRGIHMHAAERVSLDLAIRTNDPMKATPKVRKDALELARMITGEGMKQSWREKS